MGTVSSRPAREHAPAGVIDTLGTAFSIVNRRPYLVSVPVLVDVLLWLGPRLPARELVSSLTSALVRNGALPGQQGTVLQALGEEIDLMSVLASSLPSLVSALGPQTFAVPYQPPEISVAPLWAALAGVLLFVLGIAISMTYWTLLADIVRGERFKTRRFARAAARNTATMLGYLGLVLLGALGLSFLAGAVLLVATLLGLESLVLSLFTILSVVGALVFYLGTFFVEDAIVMSASGPFRSIGYSIGILRVAFWPTVRFIAAVTMIQLGLPLALRVFTTNVLAVPFALLSYAYIATGLMVASLLYYRERIVSVLRHLSMQAQQERVEERQP
ncbi:MAG: hypothetical protein N2Z82_12190 [Thermomicrobium sp.]|nr:hypothetical protein [Thermomicrobium sp.]